MARILILLVTAAMALSACGGDDEESSKGTDRAATAPAEAPSEETGPATTQVPEPDGDTRTEGEETDDEEPEGSEEATEPRESEPESALADASKITALKLGITLEDASAKLGAKPISRERGPGGTTCYSFRVRPPKDSGEEGKRLRAQLCFKKGKLRGASVVTKPPPAK